MFKEFAILLLEIDFVLTVVAFLIYFFLNIKAMYKLALILVIAGLFGRIIHEPLLNLTDSKYIWYMVWAIINFVIVYNLFILIRVNPNLQKVGVPIAFFYLLGVLLYLARHIDRLVMETNFFGKLYQIGDPALNWIVLVYLFAPIALLLVKFVRGRLSAKH